MTCPTDAELQRDDGQAMAAHGLPSHLWQLDAWTHRVEALLDDPIAATARMTADARRDAVQLGLCALREARRAVLLFPHHDTITGTSQEPVISDQYSRALRVRRLLAALASNAVRDLMAPVRLDG